jgi:hypothetical protein
MNDEEWVKEANRRWGLVAKYFKPRENLVIADFIRTAKVDDIDAKGGSS